MCTHRRDCATFFDFCQSALTIIDIKEGRENYDTDLSDTSPKQLMSPLDRVNRLNAPRSVGF